jgi:chromosome segregation ATPase
VRPGPPQTPSIALPRPRTTLTRLAIACLLFVAVGCSEPPQKEIDQAQAAVDLARTAGAEQLAPEEYAAAAAGVQKARTAVDQRDYRLALSFAIDARQRAQDALRQAAESRKRAQRDIEALYGEVATRTNRLQTLLRETDAARAKPAELRDARATLAEARKALQEASTAITLGKFDQGSKSLTGVRGKLDTAIGDLEKIPQRGGKAKASAPRKGPQPSR